MSQLAVDVVKRRGKRTTEQFDFDKLYRSLRAACLSVKAPDGHAHDTATQACKVVVDWCGDKSEVTSADIRRQAAKALTRFHPEAAYIYEHHKVMM